MLNNYERHEPDALERMVGKTLQSVRKGDMDDDVYTDDAYELTFTDGTVLTLWSADYEGYSSSIYTWVGRMT